MSDLMTAVACLADKRAPYDLLWRYYEGHQPLRYSTERLREVFRDFKVHFAENWCSTVVDVCTDRINLSGFKVENGPGDTDRLTELFGSLELGLTSDDVHLASLVCGESMLIVWPKKDGTPGAYYNDPRMVHVEYDAEDPSIIAWAGKWWMPSDKHLLLNLYYEDRVERYQSTKEGDTQTARKAFAQIDEIPNKYGRVPVFHFRRTRTSLSSELANILSLQDATNKLLSDMMVAAEYGAFPQRWAISTGDVSQLKNSPNKIWEIPAADGISQASQVGQFEPAKLDSYLLAMNDFAQKIAIISRTPKHYLMLQGGDPSGEALYAMEAPLTRKLGRYVERFSSPWRQAASFVLLIDGRDVPAEKIEPLFDPVQTMQPLTSVQVANQKLPLGVSKAQVKRELGYTDSQIEDMDIETAEEQEAMGDAMLAAFDKGQERLSTKDENTDQNAEEDTGEDTEE